MCYFINIHSIIFLHSDHFHQNSVINQYKHFHSGRTPWDFISNIKERRKII